MLKKIFIVFYSLLAALSLYVLGSLFTFLIPLETPFKLSFWFFEVNNNFLLMCIIVLALIVGFINIFIFGNDKTEDAKKIDVNELQQTETIEEEINQQIKNKYDDRIIDISTRIFDEVKKEPKPALKIEKALWSLCNELELSQGLIYVKDSKSDDSVLELKSTYAFIGSLENINKVEIGIGLNGQVAKSGDFVFIKEVPKGYMKIVSGLGEISPDYLLIIPITKDGKLAGLIELAGLGILNSEEVKTVKEMSQKIFTTII